jgi:hypothetical protein
MIESIGPCRGHGRSSGRSLGHCVHLLRQLNLTPHGCTKHLPVAGTDKKAEQ